MMSDSFVWLDHIFTFFKSLRFWLFQPYDYFVYTKLIFIWICLFIALLLFRFAPFPLLLLNIPDNIWANQKHKYLEELQLFSENEIKIVLRQSS